MAGALRKTMLYLGLADDPHAEYGEAEYETEALVPDYQADVTPLHRTPAFGRTSPSYAPSSASADLRRITTIHPRSYNEARQIGDAFRDGTPVIMNLTDMDDSTAKRLVDFSAGLIFGLRGSIERVTNKVFLLSPEHVEIATEQPQDPTPVRGPGGLFDQA